MLNSIQGSKQRLKELAAYSMIRHSRRSPLPVEELEQLHLEPTIPDFNDSSYFFGGDGRGTSIATRLAFRTGKPDEAWLELRLPQLNGLSLSLREDSGSRGAGFQLGELLFVCDEVGQSWRIRYRGPVEDDTQASHDLELDLRFEASSPVVDFARYADSWAVARAMANRKWSRQFFEKMRDVKKVHYEQGGRISGTIRCDGELHDISLPGVRDHSFGRRVWGQWNRHLWLLGAFDDGSFFNISMIKYDFIDTLRAGWRWVGGPVLGLKDCDDFDHFGLANEPPADFECHFTSREGPREKVVVHADTAMDFSLDGGEYLIREWIANFSIGGIKGSGVAEFGWNPQRHGGLPDSYSSSTS